MSGRPDRPERITSKPRWLLLLAAALLVAWGTGCGTEDSGNPPPIARPPADDGGDGGDPGNGGQEPAGGLVLEVDPSAVTAGDAGATVTATVTDGAGAAVVGTAVNFTVSPASVATLQSSQAVTDEGGVARVTVVGVRRGSATLSASTGDLAGTAALTVLAPRVSIAVAPAGGEAVVSSPSGAGATVTVTVTDQGGGPLEDKTVTFTTTLGVLDAASRKTGADGTASVKLTSPQVGEALVTASVLGESSEAVTVVFGPAELDTLTLSTSSNTIPVNGSATITIQAEDAFGNALDGVSVELDATRATTGTPTGSLSPETVALIDGQGQSIFTPSEVGVARIAASVDGAEVAFLDVSVEVILAGEPARIQFTIPPEEREITVKGSGGVEAASIEIEVTDVNGDPIVDVPSNLEVEIISGPGGGESLDGLAGVGEVRTLSTAGGQATTVLQSGTRPGTVQIEVRATKDSRGNDLDVPLAAGVPQVTIRSGPPASLFLTPANAIQSPGLAGQGSITHDYLAFVSDLWGNAVPDETIVFFSQFLNIIAECRNRSVFDPLNETDDPADGFVVETCAGEEAGTLTPSDDPLDTRATFVTGSVPLDGVSPGDTLVILTEDNPLGLGGYRIGEVVDSHTARLDGDVSGAADGLEWAVGNNANLGGGVFTTEGQAATQGGVARWSNTYAGELVNEPVYIYAEAEGGTQGHARSFRLAWLADTSIEQTAGPEGGDEVSAGSRQFFSFFFEDASAPTPYAIPSLFVTASATGGTLEPVPGDDAFLNSPTFLELRTSARSISRGESGGSVGFFWTVPDDALPEDEFTVSISGGGETQRIELTVQ